MKEKYILIEMEDLKRLEERETYMPKPFKDQVKNYDE